ncbi:MAG: hypothetical protein Q8J59_12185 [Methylotenera sp.]|nr:hypothetical protein [Methylotenera sp.]MDP2282427.1 hypothetical protein [Methylotenera sp.]MDP3060319.1 hypothetical protein [Methylotenera sp.]
MSIKSAKVMDLNEFLILIHRAGYMRCIELSQFTKKELPIVVEIVKTLLNLKFIISRTLPDAAGDIYYLSTKGAEHLIKSGVQVNDVYKLEKFINDEWKCTNDWKHHLMSLGAISHLIEQSSGEPIPFYFEREVKRAYPYLVKYPDGLIIYSATSGNWIEVENSVKGGDKLELMCQTIINAKMNTLPTLFGITFSSVMVCVDPDAKDLKHSRINHIQRVRNKLETMVTEDVYFGIAYMEMDHHRVLSIETGEIYAERNVAKLILGRLELVGWYYCDYFSDNTNTLGIYNRDWGAHYTIIGDKEIFWEVGIIDYDDSYDHNGPMAFLGPKRHVEEGLDVFKSGYATSVKACKTAITEALELLVLNDVKLHLITEFI